MVKPCFLHALFNVAYMSLFIFSSHLQSALMISLPKKKKSDFSFQVQLEYFLHEGFLITLAHSNYLFPLNFSDTVIHGIRSLIVYAWHHYLIFNY